MRFTVLGGSGFVGGALVRRLRNRGETVFAPARAELANGSRDAGHVIYCIGFTGNFRAHLAETVEAHVEQLKHCLAALEAESFLFLSSTRVYGGASGVAETREDSPIRVTPSADSVYDLSKLLGEALCLSRKDATYRVARLSNVVGEGMSRHTFLGSIVEDLRQGRDVTINEAPDSAKDYAAIDDVVDLLIRIATSGRERLYNVASGRPLRHDRLVAMLRDASGRRVEFADAAPCRAFPPIDTHRVASEFGATPRGIDPAILTPVVTLQ